MTFSFVGLSRAQCPGSPPAGIQCVGAGSNSDITAFTVCAKITNNHASGKALMVPVGNSTDWSTFRTNLAPGVTSGACGAASPTFVQSSGAIGTAAGTLHTATLSSAPTIGNTVIILSSGRLSTGGLLTVSGCGATFTQKAAFAGTNARPEIWAGACTNTGTTFTVTEANALLRGLEVLEFSSLGTNLDSADAGVHVASFSNTTAGVTTTHANSVVFVAMALDKVVTGPANPTNSFVDAGTESAGSGGNQQGGPYAYYIASGTGTYSTTLSPSGTGSPNNGIVSCALY